MPDTDLERLDKIRREVYGDLEDLLAYEDVCAVLKIERPTLTRMVSDGVFAAMRRGRKRYISLAAVRKYVAEEVASAEQERAEAAAEAAAREGHSRPKSFVAIA